MRDGTPTDPLDLTLREVAYAAGSESHDAPDMTELDVDGPPRRAVTAAFTEIHPAVAGQLVFLIERGLENGDSPQGASHPHFLGPLRTVIDE